MKDAATQTVNVMRDDGVNTDAPIREFTTTGVDAEEVNGLPERYAETTSLIRNKNSSSRSSNYTLSESLNVKTVVILRDIVQHISSR